MTGWKDWAIGEVVTESDFQSFVQDQVIQRYADSTARDTTLGASVATGMACFLEDVSLFQVYDGTEWVEISGGGTTISDTAPAGPDIGDTWWDSTNGRFFVYFDSYWVEIALAQSGPQGATGATGSTGSTGATGAAGSDGALSKNYIINSAFDFWDRGTSFGPSAATTKTLPTWGMIGSGATQTVSRQEFSPDELNIIGFGDAKYFQRWLVSTSNNNANIFHRQEEVRTLAGQEVTFSFWAKGTNPAGGELQAKFGQSFGSGGSSNIEMAFANFTVTASWQRFSVTGTIPSVSGKTIGDGSYFFVDIRVPNGDNSTTAFEVDTWGWQLEAGDTATPFKRNAPNLQGELAACQRYYYEVGAANNGAISYGLTISTTQLRASVPTGVQMRATPSVTFTSNARISGNGDALQISSVSSIALSGNAIEMNISPSSNFTGVRHAYIVSDLKLQLSAEL